MVAAGCNVIERRRSSISAGLHQAGLREEVVRLGDDTISYWDGGRGDAVVLVHGFGMAALWQWNPQVPALAGRRIVMPDLLWFGGSSSTRRDFTLAREVASVGALLEHLRLERVDLVGISYGGVVAYGVSVAQPSRVRSLTLVDSPGPAFNRADYQALLTRLGSRNLADVFVPETAQGVERLMGLAFLERPFLPDFAARQVIRESYTRNRTELRALLTSIDGELDQLTAAPAPIVHPLCLIWGREDPVFPLSFADRLQAMGGAGARRHVIEKTRHAPNVERPDEFNRALLDCVKR